MNRARGRWAATAELARALLDLLYPRHCAGCGQPAADGSGHLCWDCMSAMQVVTPPFCRLCGDPVEGVVDHAFTCSWCVDERPAFDLARSAARFRGPLREALHAFKYNRGTHLCADLALLLEACCAAHFRGLRPDAVTFVPLHPRRARERTYNQAALLAAGLAGRLRLPVQGCLQRTRATASQTSLDFAQRRRNVGGAFAPLRPAWIDGRRLLLVDDVMTTGATVAECSRVLKDAGAVAVHVVTVARG